MSKLEKPAAVDRRDEIVAVSDAAVVARGDLGVELPAERVIGNQKRIVRSYRRLGKPVVAATQMLESMTDSPVPTRAEASDMAMRQAVGLLRAATIVCYTSSVHTNLLRVATV